MCPRGYCYRRATSRIITKRGWGIREVVIMEVLLIWLTLALGVAVGIIIVLCIAFHAVVVSDIWRRKENMRLSEQLTQYETAEPE